MTQKVKVYESGSGKWVKVVHNGLSIQYESSEDRAEAFDLKDLIAADAWFGDFSIYKDTLHAVPIGTNHRPWHCETVKFYIKEEQRKLRPDSNLI